MTYIGAVAVGMECVSILNDVLGPVMRGPSSSHTAGSYRIGRMARSLLGEEPASASFTFDPAGSYANVYRQQGVDLAFAAGVMGWPMTDARFLRALETAEEEGVKIDFVVSPLEGAEHPNTVAMALTSREGGKLRAVAQSTGGGAVLFTRLDDWPVRLTGETHEIVVLADQTAESEVGSFLTADGEVVGEPMRQERNGRVLLQAKRFSGLDSSVFVQLKRLPDVKNVWTVSPLDYVKRGHPLFRCAEEMVRVAEDRRCSLGRVGLMYESRLLGLPEEEIVEEMVRRFEVMETSVRRGLDEKQVRMQLLKPSAGTIYKAEAEGKVAVGGAHTRAAARAMAVMHTCNSMGIVCAAPTGGSAGVIPGVVVTLVEEKRMTPETSAMALFAASAVGLIVAHRATFAAEVAGCQVEIGAAGAMAAAAVVEAAGGTVRKAVDAAAVAFQNTMGSVCDLVQGMCEIPCHTRNAAAAASAFVCADLVLGGYTNPVPLDETVDAVFAVGKMLPRELRCTALGGLAVAPSALGMERLR